MKERPIIFNGAMVRAILSGAKTQTRLVARPVKHPDLGNVYTPGARVLDSDPHAIERACPFGQPGDRLWVRETWADLTATHGRPWERRNPITSLYERGIHPFLWYAADGDQPDIGCGDPPNPEPWRPSIYMPRWACRLVLETTDVRVEWLQAISEADALAEGAMNWDANPWVWVISFRPLEAPSALYTARSIYNRCGATD